MKTVTEYVAGITNDGMILWSAGYTVGLSIGYFFSFWYLLIVTIFLVCAFGAVRKYSTGRHGKRVNVSLSEETIVRLNK